MLVEWSPSTMLKFEKVDLNGASFFHHEVEHLTLLICAEVYRFRAQMQGDF